MDLGHTDEPAVVSATPEPLTAPPRAGTNDNISPEARDMLMYLISTCILNHRIENQTVIFENKPSPTLSPIASPDTGNKRNSYTGSISDYKIERYHGPATSIPSLDRVSFFSSETLPRDFVLELRRRILKTIQGPQHGHYHSSKAPTFTTTGKSIYKALIPELTEAFNESVNRSRRPEDLIVVYCKVAHKVSGGENSSSEKLESLLIGFVRYIIYVLSRKGYNFTHRSLIRRLEAYTNILKKGNMLQQSISRVSKTNTMSPSLQVPLVQSSKKPVPNPDLSFSMAEMPSTQYIADLFNVSGIYMQYIIDELVECSTEEAALADLIKCQKELLTSDKHPTYAPNDFTEKNAYNKWKMEELEELASDIDSLKDSIPVYKDTKLELDQYYKSHKYIYVPRNPTKYYTSLISMCIKHDSELCEKDHFEFSPEASSLLQKAMIHWRLTAVSESMVMLQEATNLAAKGVLSFNDITDQLFPYAMEGLKTASKGDKDKRSLQLQEWTDMEKDVAYQTMSNTLEMCVSEIVGQLDLASGDVQPEIERIMDFVNSFVVPFSTFQEFPALRITENHLMAVKEQVSYMTEVRFQRETLRFPVHKAGTSVLSLENLFLLINEVKTTTSRIHTWYRSIELFGFIDLAGLATQFYLITFIKYIQQEVIAKKALCDPALYDLDELSYDTFDDILDGISDVVNIFERSMDQRATTNHEDAGISVFVKIRKILSLILLRKVESSAEVLIEWVDRIFENDSFVPLPEMSVSSSVFDLFSSFHALTKVVTNLKWNSPSMTAEFCNAAMRVSIDLGSFCWGEHVY